VHLRRARAIAVVSGKGGVGKTQIAVNLAVALARRRRRCILFDANFLLGTVNSILGLRPAADLVDVLKGDLPLDNILVDGPAGLKVAPASSLDRQSFDVGLLEQMGLISALVNLRQQPEYLILDALPGIDNVALGFCAAADSVIVVICDDVGSLSNSRTLIRILAQERGIERFYIVCNRVRSVAHGRALFAAFQALCGDAFGASIQHAANIPEDNTFELAAAVGTAVVEHSPSSLAAAAFATLVLDVESWPPLHEASARLRFFPCNEADALGEWARVEPV